jgi:hypothetical protein
MSLSLSPYIIHHHINGTNWCHPAIFPLQLWLTHVAASVEVQFSEGFLGPHGSVILFISTFVLDKCDLNFLWPNLERKVWSKKTAMLNIQYYYIILYCITYIDETGNDWHHDIQIYSCQNPVQAVKLRSSFDELSFCTSLRQLFAWASKRVILEHHFFTQELCALKFSKSNPLKFL